MKNGKYREMGGIWFSPWSVSEKRGGNSVTGGPLEPGCQI